MKKLTIALWLLLLVSANNFSIIASAKSKKIESTRLANASANDNRPNIIFILADDLDIATSPIWGAMPNAARLLRDQGITFTNAFAPTPICCPARASVLTGKYGHNTGILNNAGDFGGWETFVRNGNEQRTIALYLQRAGYKTGFVGKYLNGIENDPLHIPPGWSEWNAFVDNLSYTGYNYKMNENGTIVQYGETESDYNTDVVRNKAIEFINRAEQTDAQPFFLYVAPTAPHFPLPPAPRHQNNPYANAFSPRKLNYNEADISDKASWLRNSGDARADIVNFWNDYDYRKRMGSLYALDEAIAAIYQTLANRGEIENTIIVFTSDNGYNLGAHRLIHKMAPYEESIRIPLVVAGRGIAPRSESKMALQIDFAPTFLQLAGVAIPNDTSGQDFMDGQSLVPLLRNQNVVNWRSEAVLQYLSGGETNSVQAETPPGFNSLISTQDVPTYRALRTTNYTYIEWYSNEEFPNFHEPELYNLARDPFQLDNLLSTPAGRWQNRELAKQLKTRMNQLVVCKGNSCR